MIPAVDEYLVLDTGIQESGTCAFIDTMYHLCRDIPSLLNRYIRGKSGEREEEVWGR
jgi:hypothetical protein